MSDNFNFYEKKLWTGRLSSFTDSIDSNLKLLRVILLTKGSTILQFGNAVAKGDGLLKAGEKKWNEKETQLTDYFKSFEDGADKLGFDMPGKLGLLSHKVSQWGTGGQSKSTKALKSAGFDFEESQLYNLRTLSLKQKAFVDNRLKHCVENGGGQSKDESSLQSSKIRATRKGFQKIAADIEIVQRAIVQRVHEIEDDGTYKPSVQASALQVADKLALLSLKPFQHLLPEKGSRDIVPITFFSYETHIRRVPYCKDVVLVGIRHDQILQENGTKDNDSPPPFELLTIPHEIGHYVYQRANLKSLQGTVDKILSDEVIAKPTVSPDGEGELPFEAVAKAIGLSQTYHKWSEEIFSDICGCIVAGPLVALSLLSILVARSEDENNVADGEHPTGKLRPYILKEILEVLKELEPNQYSFDSEAQEIVSTWETLNPKSDLDFKTQIEQLRPAIRVFARILLESDGAINRWDLNPNGSSLSDHAKALGNIGTMPQLDKLIPVILDDNIELDRSDAGDDDIEKLLEEWDKDGPVTIGPH